MAKLQDLIPNDDMLNVGGYEDLVYFAPASEFVGNPKSKDKLSTPITTAGSSKDVGEAYAFVATSGKGYWRKLLCISGSVEAEFSDAGESGTLSSENVLKGKVRGNNNAAMEFYDLLGSSAGIVFLARDKSDGLLREFGTPTSPSVKSSIKGGNAPKMRGFEFETKAIGTSPRIVDDVAFPLDIVPNV